VWKLNSGNKKNNDSSKSSTDIIKYKDIEEEKEENKKHGW